jgi:hypothetical protein
MKLSHDEAEVEAKKPPCSACGKPSRAHAALYWGKHLCAPDEGEWMGFVNAMPLPMPPEMGPVFKAWLQETKARAA